MPFRTMTPSTRYLNTSWIFNERCNESDKLNYMPRKWSCAIHHCLTIFFFHIMSNRDLPFITDGSKVSVHNSS